MYRSSYALAVAAVPLLTIALCSTGCSKKQEPPPEVTIPKQPDEPVILAGGSLLLIGPTDGAYSHDATAGSVAYTHSDATLPLVKVVIRPRSGIRIPFPITNTSGEIVAIDYQGSSRDISVTSPAAGRLDFTPQTGRRKFKQLHKPYLYIVKGKSPTVVYIRNVEPPDASIPGYDACVDDGTGVMCKLETGDDAETAVEFCFSQNCPR